MSTAPELQGLDATVRRVLSDFVEAARASFGDHLRAVILHGSAAEGRLRPTSDVNVLVVLRAFDPARAAELRPVLRVAQAAVRLEPMFVLETELAPAALAFAVKFADMRRRHVVLHGDDPLASLAIPRAAAAATLRQVLLNLQLRLRRAHVAVGQRPEQVARTIADAAGPLRASAMLLLELEGGSAASPKEALAKAAARSGVAGATEAVARISEARERRLAPAAAEGTLLALSDLAAALGRRAGELENAP